jgi:hypothetical protein
MRVPSFASILFSVLLGLCSCQGTHSAVVVQASLDDPDAFGALRQAFVANNPGYDVQWHPSVTCLPAVDRDRVLFVQGPVSRIEEPTVGDLLLVRGGQAWQMSSEGTCSLLAFSLPAHLPEDLPKIVRPDWDPRITDTPGGCATEGDAYRRILLTWKPEVGPYILHALNAHRVRINNSFSHYHPLVGGFDEFYLVQQAPDGARLLTSSSVEAIESHQVKESDVAGLIQSRRLHVGDLVYLPRGTMHRGIGGALVQVISVPGFVPQSEIGVDHHLWEINKRLGLHGVDALPFHLVAARTKVVK